MKKILTCLLIGILSIGVYGCSSDEENETKQETPEVVEKEEIHKTDKEILDLGVTEEQLTVIKENIEDYDDIYDVQIKKYVKEKIDGNGVLTLWGSIKNYDVIIQNDEVVGIRSYNLDKDGNSINDETIYRIDE
jgi:hypothetical protein